MSSYRGRLDRVEKQLRERGGEGSAVDLLVLAFAEPEPQEGETEEVDPTLSRLHQELGEVAGFSWADAWCSDLPEHDLGTWCQRVHASQRGRTLIARIFRRSCHLLAARGIHVHRIGR